MRLGYIFLVIVISQFFLNPATAGLFSGNQPSSSGTGDLQPAGNEIPIRNEASKIMEKRKIEARELISEGLKLIREGERKNNEVLITKGKIKKEIGQKQLQVLKEQSEMKKKEDQSYGW